MKDAQVAGFSWGAPGVAGQAEQFDGEHGAVALDGGSGGTTGAMPAAGLGAV